MTSPDDDIIAALRRSPGDPPPVDLYGLVAAGVRRRRRHRAIGGAGIAACMAAAIAVVPMLLRGGGSVPAPPSGIAPPTCAPTLDSQPSGGPSPRGSGFVPGTPSSAVLCEYDQITPSQPLTKHVALDADELAKTLAIAHALHSTNELPSCPAQRNVDLLTFGYPDGTTVTLRIGCIVGQGDLHALLGPSLETEIRQLLAGVPTPPPSTASASSSPSPSPLPSISMPASAAGEGAILELDDEQRFALVDPVSGAAHPLPLAAVPRGPSMIATNPTGGWVVTYTPDPKAGSGSWPYGLALVDAAGNVTPFALTHGGPVSGLAVSPDGTKVAIALMGDPAVVEVMPMPGHDGTTQAWLADDADINEIISLSWAPDGKRLTYIPGSQTGAGIGGLPTTLDTSKPGKAPTKSTWPPNVDCDAIGASWLASNGAFGVVEECTSSGVAFYRANAISGPYGAPSVPLPHLGCGMPPLHPSSDGSKVLVPWCGVLYLVSDGVATPVGEHIIDAAWAGKG